MKRSAVLTILFSIVLLTFPFSASGQELAFQTHVISDQLSTQMCTFGLKSQALSGLDEFDIPAPPVSPGNSLSIHLSMMAPPASLPNRWLVDYRPIERLSEGLTEFWILEVNHDLLGETATIFIEQQTSLNTSYELWLHQPDSTSSLVSVPGFVEISLDASTLIYFWELRVENPVATENSTWGGVKSLYR